MTYDNKICNVYLIQDTHDLYITDHIMCAKFPYKSDMSLSHVNVYIHIHVIHHPPSMLHLHNYTCKYSVLSKAWNILIGKAFIHMSM